MARRNYLERRVVLRAGGFFGARPGGAGSHAGRCLECLFGHARGHVFGGVHGRLLGGVFHGAGGDLLELLRERTPPLQRVHHAGRVGLAGRCAGDLAPRGTRHARHRAGGAGSGLGGLLHAADHGVGGLELQCIGHVAHVEVHALERGQRHLLHLQRLDGGPQRLGVLVQPEMHGLELVHALVQLLDIERGRHPVGQVGHLRDGLRRTLGQVLQEVETGTNLPKPKLVLSLMAAPLVVGVPQLTPTPGPGTDCRLSVSQCLCASIMPAAPALPGARAATGTLSSSLLSTPLASLNTRVRGTTVSLASGAFRSSSITW
jgi:hypothetical protein